MLIVLLCAGCLEILRSVCSILHLFYSSHLNIPVIYFFSSFLKGQAVLMRMLVAVSSVYILCATPTIILALVRFAVPEFRSDGRYSNLFLAAHGVFFLPFILNSSVNFFVYTTMSSRFRHELQTLCLCTKTKITKSVVVSTISRVQAE